MFFHRHKFRNKAGIYSDDGYEGDLFICKCGKRKTYVDKKRMKQYDTYVHSIKFGRIYYPEFLKR